MVWGLESLKMSEETSGNHMVLLEVANSLVILPYSFETFKDLIVGLQRNIFS